MSSPTTDRVPDQHLGMQGQNPLTDNGDHSLLGGQEAWIILRSARETNPRILSCELSVLTSGMGENGEVRLIEQ